MTDQIADRLLYFIRTSLYEGKQPDDEGYYVFTRKELVEGAEISASSFDKTIAWKLEGYCSDVSYDRGKLKFKVANKKAEEWLKVPPLDYRLVYEYRQGGYRRVPGNKVIFDAFPHAWTPEQITEYNKAHGIFKSDIGDAFNESDW